MRVILVGKTASTFISGLLIGVLLASVGFAFLVRSQNQTGSNGQKTTVLKLGHSLDQKHPVHKAMALMADRLAEKSGGTVTIKIYPNSQLGTETEMLEQVQQGALAITKTSAAPMESFVPEMAIFSVPYVFRDEAHFWRVADGPIGRGLLDAGSNVGLRGLCFYDAGARSFYTVSRPILKPKDLKGMKIRVQQSKTSMNTVASLGGSPTPLPPGELYTALQQSMVDGAENNTPTFCSNRHFEVCKHLSLDEHTRVPDLLTISEKVWNRLNEPAKQWVLEAAAESVKFQREQWNAECEKALATVAEHGVTVHRPDQAPFAACVNEMWESYDGTSVGDLIQDVTTHE